MMLEQASMGECLPPEVIGVTFIADIPSEGFFGTDDIVALVTSVWGKERASCNVLECPEAISLVEGPLVVE